MTLLKASDIKMSFKNNLGKKMLVLDGISMNIDSARITVIMGESGSGKSTLMHILGGFLTPDQGEVMISGQSLYHGSDSDRAALIRANIGFVFQSFHLIPTLTVHDNLALALVFEDTRKRLQLTTQKDIDRRISETLFQLGIAHKLNEFPTQLSGGEKQRVAIARAIIHRPKLVICDEPTGNLDDTNTNAFKAMIKEISKTSAILIVTHDQRLLEMSDHIQSLKNGKLSNTHP
jgi:ABC-type lipoprotein export system ATPase subunit